MAREDGKVKVSEVGEDNLKRLVVGDLQCGKWPRQDHQFADCDSSEPLGN
jgi:hypothetical protein